MLALVQTYRGFAALLVVLYHAAGAVRVFFGGDIHAFDFGWSGVQFFFVLSGYIIMHVHGAEIGTPARLGNYMGKRLLRIYPLYILISLALVPAWFLIPSDTEPYRTSLVSLLLSVALIPQPHPPNLSVAWTLIHEMFFYVMFAILLWNRRIGICAFAAWAALVVWSNVTAHLDYPLNYFGSINNLLFGFGMLAAMIRRDFGWPLFFAGNLLFVTVGMKVNLGSYGDSEILAFGAASFAILLCARKLDRFFRARAFMLLGDASYSIYLVHYPAISLLCKVLHMGSASAFIACVAFALVCGVATHLLIEKPLLRWLRARFARSTPRIPAAEGA